MLKIKEIRYLRVKNLGNYESERLELVAELDDDNVESAIAFTALVILLTIVNLAILDNLFGVT